MNRKDIHDCVERLAADTGCSDLLSRFPETLSEGQIQRVALARTQAAKPSCLLLDEPISSLDVPAKSEIRALLRSINRSGMTIIHVTHDYEEAVSLATRIAVIEDGSLSQTGSPREIFQHPKSEFIAKFVGIKNIFKGELVNTGDKIAEFKNGKHRFYILTEQSSGKGHMILRGEDITLSNTESLTSARNTYKGIIKDIEENRLKIEVTVDIGMDISAMITRDALENLDLRLGKVVWVTFKASAAIFIEE